MNQTPTMWELCAAGLAIGGTAVWALAAAARVGVLRAVLEIFPRGSWDAVTWVLIPALLLAPIVVQGLAVAALSRRHPAAWTGVAAGAVGGALVALAAIGAALLVGVRQLPRGGQLWLTREASEPLIIAFIAAIVAGWLVIVARLARARWLRWAALPVAAAAVAVAWMRAHHTVVALSYVLDRPEANGFFSAVAVGGAAGSAWAASRPGGGRRRQPAHARTRSTGDGRAAGVSRGD